MPIGDPVYKNHAGIDVWTDYSTVGIYRPPTRGPMIPVVPSPDAMKQRNEELARAVRRMSDHVDLLAAQFQAMKTTWGTTVGQAANTAYVSGQSNSIGYAPVSTGSQTSLENVKYLAERARRAARIATISSGVAIAGQIAVLIALLVR